MIMSPKGSKNTLNFQFVTSTKRLEFKWSAQHTLFLVKKKRTIKNIRALKYKQPEMGCLSPDEIPLLLEEIKMLTLLQKLFYQRELSGVRQRV